MVAPKTVALLVAHPLFDIPKRMRLNRFDVFPEVHESFQLVEAAPHYFMFVALLPDSED